MPLDSFLHIADLHFWRVVLNPLRLFSKRVLGNLTVILRRRHEFVMDRAAAFSDHVASLGITTVLLTGDFTSTSLDEEFEMAVAFVRGLRQRGLTVHVLPGNHDVYTFASRRNRQFEHHFAEFLPAGGYPARVTLPGGTPLILVPTVCPRILTARGAVSGETLQRVTELLRDAPAPLVVASHYPLLASTHAYHSNRTHALHHAADFREVLASSSKRILHVAGHVHRFSYLRDASAPALEHLTSPAFFRHKKGDEVTGAFSEIHVAQDRFGVFTHTRTDSWRREEQSPAASGSS